MYVVSVAPLVGTFGKGHLSYFTKESLPKGALVQISLRKKPVYGLVLESTPLQNAKSVLRREDFSIKKIERIISRSFFTETFLEAAEILGEDMALSAGQVLSSIIPNFLLENASIFEPILKKNKNVKKKFSKSYVQTSFARRLKYYRDITKQAEKKHESVFIAIPSIQQGETMRSFFEQHFSNIFFLHSSLSQKNLRHFCKEVLESQKPVVIIGTPAFLSLPRSDIKTIILEDSSNEEYRGQKRPYLDIRLFVETFAKTSKATFISGASVLSTEDFYLLKNRTAKKAHAFRENFDLPKQTNLIDMAEEKKETERFEILSKAAHDLINTSLKKKTNIFLFCIRKGVAGTTICQDCGMPFLCKNCSVPMSLFNTKEGRTFICGQCHYRTSAKVLCRNCGSYRLIELGIGVDRVVEYIKKTFPGASVFVLDGENTKTHRQANLTISKWNNQQGSILVGTEKALPYIDKAETSIIVSIDSLFSIPDFRINTKIFSLLVKIAERTDDTLLIQTRNAKASLVKTFLKGDIRTFHEKDLEERKKLGFTPYQSFIKITFKGKKEEVSLQKEKVKKFFQKYEVDMYPAFHEKVRNQTVTNALLSLPPDKPLEDDLKNRLRLLPPSYEIRVYPQNLL